jgi:hypothetical protein
LQGAHEDDNDHEDGETKGEHTADHRHSDDEKEMRKTEREESV